MLDLKESPELIAAYRRLHSKEGIWPEILQGIKDSGVLEMEIYILANHLFMILDLPSDLSFDDAMNAMAAAPRQAEWEAFVSRYQKASADARSDGKWQKMERIFHLYE